VSNPYAANPYSPEARVWELAQRTSGKTDAEVIQASQWVPHDGTLLRQDLIAQYKRDCMYQERVSRMPIDRSAAFTALLDLSPEFGRSDNGGQTITRMLTDYYESGQTDMYAFTKGWLADHGYQPREAEPEMEAS
jgi:hypothetical protein